MPEQRPVPVMPDVDLEQGPLVTALEQMKSAYALSLVNKTFWNYDTFRQQNHDTRWKGNDALYLGWMPQRVWEGTTVPRSSLSMPMVFDQVESALPSITQAIFGSQPEWFGVEADTTGTPQEARQVASHLNYVLTHNERDYGLSAKNDLELAIKSLLLYGNGGVAIEWDPTQKMPKVSWLDVRDVYFDPGASMPSVDYCRSVIRRSEKTVEEILSWKENPKMKVPGEDQLWAMAMSKQYAAGDQTKQVSNALLGVNFAPGTTDNIPNPTDKKIEVLTYYSKSRIIMVLNREWVAYNEANPYGFIPMAFAPCYTVLGRFYAMSVADVQEGNQRYIEALMNARLDEVHLSLHPPRAQKASSMMTPAQQRWRPGMVFKMANPKEDIMPMMPTGATTNVFSEVEYIERLSEKRTGINSLGSGIPRPSNANRTLGGMQMQMEGSANRLQSLVKNIEDYLLTPLLYKMHRMIQVHTAPDELLPAQSAGGNQEFISASVFQKPMKFKIQASSQMMTRDKLQAQFPFILQYLANGQFVGGLSQVGMAIDWTEMFQFLQDATGIGKLYALVRPMNEQEKQAMNQPPPELQAKQQQAQQDAQVRMTIADKKNQTDLQIAQMDKEKSPMEMQAEQQKMQMELYKGQMELELEKQKMALEKQKAEMGMQLKRMEMEFKAQEMQMKQFLDAQGLTQKYQMEQQKSAMDMELSQQQHAQSMQQSEQQAALSNEQAQAQHQQVMAQTQEAGNMKREQMKQTQALRPKAGAKQETGKKKPVKPKVK